MKVELHVTSRNLNIIKGSLTTSPPLGSLTQGEKTPTLVSEPVNLEQVSVQTKSMSAANLKINYRFFSFTLLLFLVRVN